MLFDLSGVVAALADQNALTVERQDAPTAVDPATGRIAGEPSTTSFTINALVHPVAGKKLEQLMDRFEDVTEAIRLHTTTELRIGTEENGLLTDRVIYNTKKFDITEDNDFSSIAGFFKYIAVRRNRGT